MLVSTKGRYALRVMIVLAENSESYAPLKEIAESEGISEKYMESILVMLTKVGILEGLRGKGGGYRLARPADKIALTTDQANQYAIEDTYCPRRSVLYRRESGKMNGIVYVSSLSPKEL